MIVLCVFKVTVPSLVGVCSHLDERSSYCASKLVSVVASQQCIFSYCEVPSG